MRKISKNKTEEDIISSTNGSLENDQTEVREMGAPEKSGSESEDNSDGSDYDKDSKKQKKIKKKSNKKKTANNKNTEEEYEVEKIIDAKKIKGKLHYLIRWKGYSADSDTWEPENTLSCPELIEKFKEEDGSKSKESKTNGKTKKRKSTKDISKSPAKKVKGDWDGENADENAEYEVERILEVHHKKNGQKEFLVHWKGWSNKFDSWEPENHLNCPELIKKFMDKVESARTKDARTLRVAPETTNRFTLQAPSSGRRLSKRRGQRQRVRYDNAE